LSDVVSLSTDDLYVTVGAGMSLAELQATLAKQGFWVPLTSPWADATVGGVLAARANGPLRPLYGGVRDCVLALEAVLADGRILRFGRPLVKDVAGYQMAKLFVGSYGTLGLVTQVSLRLRPLPLARRSVVATATDLPHAMRLASAGLAVAMLCSGAVLVPQQFPDGANERWRLVVTVEGHPADVTVEVNAIRRALDKAGVSGLEVSPRVTGVGVWKQVLEPSGFVIRAAVPPEELPGCLAGLEVLREGRCVIDVPDGMVSLAGTEPDLVQAQSWLKALRGRAEPLGGHAVMVAGPRPWLSELDAWGTPPESLELMQRLKRRWDPAGILNSSEFVVHRVE
jgi:D-lactate dehydrogenase (cytochrome)